MSAHIKRQRFALALLTRNEGLTRKAGQFLGQVRVEPFTLSDKQQDWLDSLAQRAGLSMEDFSDD